MESPDKPTQRLEATLSPAETPNRQPRISREELRERERKSRLRRVEKTSKMRQRVAELEQMALALQVAPDDDNAWDEYIDSDIKRMRGAVRRLLPAVQEAKQLQEEKVQLETLVADHKYSALMMRHILESEATEDDWETKTEAWKKLTRLHFRPWTRPRVEEVASRAMLEMDQFALGRDSTTTGMSFMGWYDRRRVVADSTSIQFSLYKKMRPGYTLDQHLVAGWRIFTDEAMYQRVVLGGRGRVSLDIVQRITPTACVVRVAEKHDGVDAVVHKMMLLARVETDEGAVFLIQGFQDSEVQGAISSDLDWWTLSSTWVRYESLEPDRGRDAKHYRMYMGGVCDVGNAAFLPKWFAEILGIAIRAEASGTGHYQLTF